MEQQAKWIRTPEKYGEMSPEFRKEFSLKGAVKKATATVTTMGVYNLYVNGKKAGNAVLAPYWTSYPARVQEQEYDITNLLAENNTVGILVGKGWAMGKMGYNPEKYFTGYFAENLSLIASITVEYEDGTADVIATDD
ncbi:MAG: alpha-L-rhamnosidase N-terminal domain-containing protein, partial [Clostridia bacterium]|nr:alpha-L-rhamnosidase N-terminal domain-containing protein [Clostridia bacterium]